MGGPGSGRKKGMSSSRSFGGGARKLVGKKVAFGKTKGFVSNKVAARETNKMFKRKEKITKRRSDASMRG
jgi:hypothetical protein